MSTENKKFYTKGWIYFITYIGGPVAGCYLMSKNFENLNNTEFAEKSLRIGIIATVVLSMSLIFIPENIVENIPNSLIPIMYTAVIAMYVEKFQAKEIEERIKNGSKKESGWKAFGIGILCLTIEIGFAFLLIKFIPEI